MYTGSSKSDTVLTKNAHETINDITVKAHDTIDGVSKQASRATDIAHRELQANPVRSTLIALGVGYLLGRIL